MAHQSIAPRLDNVSRGLVTSTTPAFAADSPATIIVGDQAFTVSASQLAFDSPNFFSDALDGQWAESSSRRIVVPDRSPELFRLILDYLCGYDILPLSERACPPRMSIEVTRRNLLHDARYYGLDGLVALLSDTPQVSRPRVHTQALPSLDVGRDAWNGSVPQLAGPVRLGDVDDSTRTGVTWSPQGLLVAPVPIAVEDQTMAVFSSASAQMVIEPRPWANSVVWTFKFSSADLRIISSVLPPGTNVTLSGSCGCIGLSRQLRISINGVDTTPDTLNLWSSCRIAREGRQTPVQLPSDKVLEPLDSVIALPFKVYSAQETLRIALVVDRLWFAIGASNQSAYIIPARTLARYFADFDDAMPQTGWTE